MDNYKCKICNGDLIKMDGYYECPWCNARYDISSLSGEKESDDSDEKKLIDAVSSFDGSLTDIEFLAKHLLTEKPDNLTGRVLLAFARRRESPESYKDTLKNYVRGEDQQGFDIVIPFLIDNSEFKFLSVLEDELISAGKIEDYQESFDKAKARIEKDEEQYSNDKADVFVCYSSNDLSRVEQVVDVLEEDGVSCWYANRNVPKNNPTEFEYKKRIESAIRNCRLFLVIASKDCMYSDDAKWELEIAEDAGKKKAEYLISNVKHTTRFKAFFDGIQWIDATEDDQYPVLLERINYLLNSPKGMESPSETEGMVQNPADDFDGTGADEGGSDDEEEGGTNGASVLEDDNSLSSDFSNRTEEGMRAYEEGNIDQAYNLLIDSSNEEAADVLNEIGKCYLMGKGCTADSSKAFQSFVASANLGSAKAKSNIAWCYQRGRGVDKDVHKAADFYQSAARSGNAYALYAYSMILLSEDTDLNDLQNGIENLKEAAEMGVSDAQFALGRCYFKGNGVEQNDDDSLYWLDKAINGGSKKAAEYKERHFGGGDDEIGSALEPDDEI